MTPSRDNHVDNHLHRDQVFVICLCALYLYQQEDRCPDRDVDQSFDTQLLPNRTSREIMRWCLCLVLSFPIASLKNPDCVALERAERISVKSNIRYFRLDYEL